MNLDNLSIWELHLLDVDSLQKISRETFSETFGSDNSQQNMKNYLENNFSKEQMLKELNNKQSMFFFAELKGKLTGYLKINVGKAQTEIQDDNSLEIERIYILKKFQGYGIGRALLKQAIQLAHEKNKNCIWLGVWEKNKRAIKFYKKQGFNKFDTHIFKLGDDEQTDILMKLEIHKTESL